MIKKKIKQFVSGILTIIVLSGCVDTTYMTLAKQNDKDVKYESSGAKKPSNGGGGNGNDKGFIKDIAGLKLSVIDCGKNKYYPKIDGGERPYYSDKTPYGLVGNGIPESYNIINEEYLGCYGIAPIYFVPYKSDWKYNDNEYGVTYSNKDGYKLDLAEGQLKGKIINGKSDEELKLAVEMGKKNLSKENKQYNLLTASAIWDSFTINDEYSMIYKDGTDIFKNLHLYKNNRDGTKQPKNETDYNKSVLMSIMNLIGLKYLKMGESEIYNQITKLTNKMLANETEVMILIEPMIQYKLEDGTTTYITPNSFQIGSSKSVITPENYPKYALNFNQWFNEIYDENIMTKKGLNMSESGSHYMLGMMKDKQPIGTISTGAGGSGIENKQAECITSKISYTGPMKETNDERTQWNYSDGFVSEKEKNKGKEDYKWGWGAICSYDYIPDVNQAYMGSSTISLVSDSTTVSNMGACMGSQSGKMVSLNQNIENALNALNSMYQESENLDMTNEIVAMLLETRYINVELALEKRGDVESVENDISYEDLEGLDSKEIIKVFKGDGLSDEKLKEYEAVASIMLNSLRTDQEKGFNTPDNIQLIRYLYLRGESININSNGSKKTDIMTEIVRKQNDIVDKFPWIKTIGEKFFGSSELPSIYKDIVEKLTPMYYKGYFMMKTSTSDIELMDDSLIDEVDRSMNVTNMSKFLEEADATYGATVKNNLEGVTKNELIIDSLKENQSNEEYEDLVKLMEEYKSLEESERSDLSKVLDESGYVIKPVAMYNGYIELKPKYMYDLEAYNTSTTKDKFNIELREIEKEDNYITIPKTGLYKESSEIQTLITDYIADTREFLRIVKGGIVEKEINERMQKELQIRVLMYLDIIRDKREGVTYEGYVESEKGSKDKIWGKDKESKEWGMWVGENIEGTKNADQDSALSMVICNIGKEELERVYGKIREEEYEICPNYTVFNQNSSIKRVIEVRGDKGSEEGLKREIEEWIGERRGEETKIGKGIIIREGKEVYINTGKLISEMSKYKIEGKAQILNIVRKYTYMREGGSNGIDKRLDKLSKANGTENIVKAIMDGYIGYESKESELLYGVMEIENLEDIEGIAYHGLYGQKYASYINSDVIARLMQCVTLVSTYCKAETGVLTGAGTNREYAIYYIPGAIRGLVENPWGEGKRGIKVKDIKLSNVNDRVTKSYVTVMNANDKNYDTRISTFSDIMLNPKDISHMDALLTTILADTLASEVEVKELANSNRTFVNQRISGSYGFGGAIIQTAIPVDIIILYRNKRGEIVRKELSENATGAIPEMLSAYNITDLSNITSNYKNIKIEYAFMNPSSSNKNIDNVKFIRYIMEEMKEMDKSEERSRELKEVPRGTIAVDTAKVILQKYPFEYSYKEKVSGKDKKVSNKFLYTLSMTDGFNYAALKGSLKSRKAQIVLVAEELEGIKQINIVTEENGELYEVKEVKPEVKNSTDRGKEIKLEEEIETKGRKAKIEEWVVKEGIGKVEEVRGFDKSKGKEEGKGLEVEVGNGETVYVHYKIGSKREEGNIGIKEKEISKRYTLADLGSFKEGVPIKASGIWGKVEKIEPLEHAYYKNDDCASSTHTNPETGESSTRYFCSGHLCTLYSKIIEPMGITKYKSKGISGKDKGVVGKGKGYNYEEVKGTTEYRGNWNWEKLEESIVPNLEFIVWRYNDIPTIATYKNNNEELKILGLEEGKKPKGERSKERNTISVFKTGFEVESIVNPIYQRVYHEKDECSEANLKGGRYDTSQSEVEYGKSDINYEIEVGVDLHFACIIFLQIIIFYFQQEFTKYHLHLHLFFYYTCTL